MTTARYRSCGGTAAREAAYDLNDHKISYDVVVNVLQVRVGEISNFECSKTTLKLDVVGKKHDVDNLVLL